MTTKYYRIEGEFKAPNGKTYDAQAVIEVDSDNEVVNGLTEFATTPEGVMNRAYDDQGDEVSEEPTTPCAIGGTTAPTQ